MGRAKRDPLRESGKPSARVANPRISLALNPGYDAPDALPSIELEALAPHEGAEIGALGARVLPRLVLGP